MSSSSLARAVFAVPLVGALAALAASAGACSSSEATSGTSTTTNPAVPTGTEIAANADSTLDGEYVASGVGPIDDVTFADGSSYVMWASPCPATGSCLAIGTYAVSSDATQLTLTDGVTTEATPLAYQALTATTDPVTANSLVLRPDGLVTTDGGPLVKSTVSTATVGTQTVKLVTPVAQLISSSNSNCVMSLPISGSPASFLAAAKTALAAKNGSISGTTTAGTFSVPGPLGMVNGSYSVMGSAAQLTVTPSSLNFLQSCSKVYSALKAALGTSGS